MKSISSVIVFGLLVLFLGTAYIGAALFWVGIVIILIGILGPLAGRGQVKCRSCGRKWKVGQAA